MLVVLKKYFGVILSLVISCSALSKVSVKNGAFHNVIVSFSPKIPAEHSTQILNSTKQLLEETSSILHKAIGLKIGSVILHLPLSWSLSYPTSFVTSSDSKYLPDIRVESVTDSAFGQYPVARQFGGCRVPGLEIALPEDFLKTYINYPKGKILAREWLKYRYGVFDENGFEEDPVYPRHYTIPGDTKIHVTDCTSPAITYNFRDAKDNNCSLSNQTSSTCFIYPDDEKVQNIQSSLMFFHNKLTSMEHICDDGEHPHNKASPNKHNLLCEYKSIMEVVKQSGDLDEDKLVPNANINQNIQYAYIQESRLRLVIIFQNTESLEKQEKIILNGVRKIMYDLPLQSKVGVYSFKDIIEEIRPFSEITLDSDREVRLTSTFQTPIDPCIACAINKAIDVLQADSPNEIGRIFIITASEPGEDVEILRRLQKSDFCLDIVAFSGASKDGWQNFRESSSCNSFWKIHDESKDVHKFEMLYKALESVLPLPSYDSRIVTVATGNLSSGEFLLIPAEVNADSYNVCIFGRMESNFIKCEVGETPIDLQPKVRTENLLQVSFNKQMDTVKCSLQYTKNYHLIQIQMVTRPGAYFNNLAWILDTTPQNIEEQMPIIIYAKINYGLYPVMNADVKAVITSPNGVVTEIPLLDDGRGDPDITRNDGVYSRYFIQFDSKGDYTIVITANDNKMQAKIGKNGATPCCGSKIFSDAQEIIPFQWTFETVVPVSYRKPEKGYKPSRVLDLKVDSFTSSSIVLKWTAPGGEMTEGQAHLYMLNIYKSQTNLFDYKAREINMTTLPKKFGEEETFEISLDELDDNTTYSFELLSLSSTGQAGDTSNLVSIFLPKGRVIPDEITPESRNSKESGVDAATVGLIVGLVILCIIVIVVIYIVGYFVFVRPKQRRRERTESRDNHISLPRTSPFGVNSIPADVILKHHNDVINARNAHKDPPIFKEENIEIMQSPSRSLETENAPPNNGSVYTLPEKSDTMRLQGARTPKRMTVV